MIILALDCATCTGWATRDAQGRVTSGLERFDIRRGDSAGMRFVRFTQWLGSMMTTLEPDVIAYEIAHHRGGAATEICVGFTTRIQELAALRGIEYAACAPNVLKKFATGAGNADKDSMRASAMNGYPHYREKLLLTSLTHDVGGDEADALLLLAWAEAGFPQPKRKVK